MSMPENKPFRRGDEVAVHWGNGDISLGRVICNNRKSAYRLSVIVLAQTPIGEEESVEAFTPEGGKREGKTGCHITHGWPE